MTEVMPKIGASFPNKSIGQDAKSILEYAPQAEAIGLDFIAVYDHVVGADLSLRGPETTFTNCQYNSEYSMHEPMVLLGAMAALTKRIRFLTGCIVSPQRQTALLAKQAAEIDIISDGRLDLGVCVGWNRAEFEALGMDFHTRGSRIEEQVEVMRALWTQDSVNHKTATESLHAVALNPRPIQQPIPTLFGGLSMKAIERAARVGDGWVPMGLFDDEMKARLDVYWEQVKRNEVQDPQVVGMVNPWIYSRDDCMRQYEGWVLNGATHVAIGTLPDCFKSTEQYFTEVGQFAEYLRM